MSGNATAKFVFSYTENLDETLTYDTAYLNGNPSISYNPNGTANVITATPVATTEAGKFAVKLTTSGLAAGKYKDTIIFKCGETEVTRTIVELEVTGPRLPKVKIETDKTHYIVAAGVNKPQITMTCSEAYDSIIYTVDGTRPDTSKTYFKYSAPFALSADESDKITIRALAYKKDYDVVKDSVNDLIIYPINLTPAPLPLSYNGSGDTLTNYPWLDGTGLGEYHTNGKNKTHIKIDDQDKALYAAMEGTPSGLTYSVRTTSVPGAESGFSFLVECSSDGNTWNTLKTHTASEFPKNAEEYDFEVVIPSALQSSKYIRWIYNQKPKGINVALGNISIEPKVTGSYLTVSKATKETKLTEEIFVDRSYNVDIRVNGQELTGTVAVNKAKGGDAFTVPTSLALDKVLSDDGDVLKVVYTPTAAGKDTAVIEVVCGDKKDTAYIYTEVIAPKVKTTIADVYDDYSSYTNSQVYKIGGDVVITNLDSNFYNGNNTLRVWVQDTGMSKTKGRSLQLYISNASPKIGYSALHIGDTLHNIYGKLNKNNSNLRYMLLDEPLSVKNSGSKVYVDSIDDISLLKAAATLNNYSNALVCIKNVVYKKRNGYNGDSIEVAVSDSLLQGNTSFAFRTDFRSADYLGDKISVGRLYVTGILTRYSNTLQITPRSRADMVEAPCLVPQVEVQDIDATTATLAITAEADSFMYKLAASEAELATATEVKVKTKSVNLTGLEEVTTYYYQVKSLCSPTATGEYSAAASFETMSSGAPRITILCPVKHNGQDSTFTDSVTVTYTVANATLGVDDTIVRISFGGKVVDTVYTVDTAYKRLMPTGSYTVKVELMKKDSVTPMEKSVNRSASFKVDLPDAHVAILPNGGNFRDSAVARISSTTSGVSIFYSLDSGEPNTAYNPATDSIIIRQTGILKVMAVKEKMDTARASARFVIINNPTPVGLVVFEENFSKIETAATSAIAANKFDERMDEKGWSGTYVYPEIHGVKIGSGTASGSLVSRKLNLGGNNGVYYITFKAGSFVSSAGVNDEAKVKIVAGDSTLVVEGLDGATNNLKADGTGMNEFVLVLNNGTDSTQIKFETETTGKRYFLSNIKVYQDRPAFIELGEDVTMAGILNGTKQATVSVQGYKLTDTVKFETPRNTHNAFAVSPAYLVKDSANKTNNLTVTYTARTASGKDTLMIVAKSGDLKDTAYVYAQTLPCVAVADTTIHVDAAATSAAINVTGADSLRYQYKTKAATTWSTAANTTANAIALSGLTAETEYVVRIQRICGAGYYSEAVEKAFTTLSATAKNVILVQPTANQKFTGEVAVKFRPVNFKMGDSGVARVMFSTNDTVYLSDTVCTKVMASGSYTVKVELLKKDSTAFTPAVTAGPVSFTVELPKAAKPVATPDKADSIYIDSVNVTLATATAGAKIYYKLNNASWAEYTTALKLTVGNHTLKAYAKGEFTENSDTLTATYNVKVQIKGVKLFEEEFSKAALASDWDKGTKLTAEIMAANTDEEGWTLTEGINNNSVYAGAFGGAKFGTSSNKGSLTTRALDLRKDAGTFYVAFKAASYKSDNSVLTVSTATETKTVNDLPGIQNTDSTLQDVVLVFEDGADVTNLTFTFSKRGMLDAICIYQDTTKPAANRVAMPLFSPVAGEYLDSVKVTLTCATSGASIFYSLDGSEPATAYTAPFTVKQTTTVKAVAKKEGMSNSRVASALYTIKTATPVATLEALYEQTADNTTVYKVTGDLVVSFMDSYNNRVWLQDKGMNDEEGAGMLVFKAADYGYSSLQVGDVVKGLQGTLTVYNGLYEVNPTAVMTASSHNGSIFVWDAKIADLKNANTYLAYQSTLVKLQKVHFLVSEGTKFEKNKTYLVSDGTDTIDFYCTFANADYIGSAIPTGEIYLIGMMGYYNKPQITARSLNDLNGAGVGFGTAADGVAFAVYPNPNNGKFFVNLNEEASIEVYNALGVKVLNRTAATGLSEIKLGSAGVYFVKVVSGERSSVKRVIVR